MTRGPRMLTPFAAKPLRPEAMETPTPRLSPMTAGLAAAAAGTARTEMAKIAGRRGIGATLECTRVSRHRRVKHKECHVKEQLSTLSSRGDAKRRARNP